MNWSSEEAAIVTKGRAFSSWDGGKLVFDSRLVEKGDIFIALPGVSVDGHDFIKAAFDKGAAGAIVSKIPEAINQDKLILVDDTLTALSDMAIYKRSKSNAKFIGITGSVGKTSTKELLGLALSVYGKTFISRGNYNNFLGVPINLASMPYNTEYAVIEMGMDHAGEIMPLSDLVKPDIAIITAIENIHRANFDSIEGIAEAKAEIFYGMSDFGTVIINALSNCYELLRQKAEAHKIISLGIESKISSYQVKENNTEANLNILGKEINLKFDNIMGRHQIHNMMAALTCVESLGLNSMKAVHVLEQFKLPRGRGMVSRITVDNKSIILIDDSYNAGPVSVKAALKTMSYYSGRKIAILGDMTEMGPESVCLHAALKEDIITNNIDKVICFGNIMRNLYEVLPENKKFGSYLTLKDLANELPNKLIDGDILLIKGSLYLTNLYEFTKHLIEGKLDILSKGE